MRHVKHHRTHTARVLPAVGYLLRSVLSAALIYREATPLLLLAVGSTVFSVFLPDPALHRITIFMWLVIALAPVVDFTLWLFGVTPKGDDQ